MFFKFIIPNFVSSVSKIMSKSVKGQPKKNRGDSNPNNLKNMAPLLYLLIQKYDLSKIYLAKRMNPKDWDDNDKAKKHRLTINLRNKLDGTGKLEKSELVEIQSILLELADSIKNNVNKTIVQMERKEKIEKLAKYLEGKSEEEIDKFLNKI